MTTTASVSFKTSGQRFSKSGRIRVRGGAQVIRIIALIALAIVAGNNIRHGLVHNDMMVVYGTLMLSHALIILSVAWFFYKNPAIGTTAGNELVTIIIPIYNEKAIIRFVIDAIYKSTYKNLEVIAVDDGSTDETPQILDDLSQKYPNLRVVHKENEGKRRAIATGYYASEGKYIVIIDSDSIIDAFAIEEVMKVFEADPKVGAISGHAKLYNSGRSFLTNLQDAWYDYGYNIRRSAESAMGCILCCPGGLGAYRREAIAEYIPYWASSRIQFSDDRMLTSYVLAPKSSKIHFKSQPRAIEFPSSAAIVPSSHTNTAPKVSHLPIRPISAQDLDKPYTSSQLANSDDAGFAKEWKTMYVASAIFYTEVPENMRKFLRQLLRWKKGTIRTNVLYVSGFFWRKSTNPLMSLIFYIDLMAIFTSPLIIFLVTFYYPFVLHDYLVSAHFLVGFALAGVIYGLDYRFRDSKSKYWIYSPLMFLFQFFVLTWLLFPAIWRINRNEWLTR